MRRSWRKLYLGVDAGTGRIVASLLTARDVDDGSQVGPLLDRIEDPLASFTGDGAYDQEGVTVNIGSRHPHAAIIVPPRSTAVPSDMAETAPTQRDCHLRTIAEHGRMAWQAASGYTKRARAETAMSCFKRVIGVGLRSHTDETPGDRGGNCRSRPQPHAGSRTPELRPHRLIVDWARSHRVHPIDPCNNAGVDRALRRQVFGQMTPRDAAAQDVEDAVLDLSHRPQPGSAEPAGRREKRLDDAPLGVGQIG